MTWCLIPKYADFFKQQLRDGTITPETLNAMTSQERHDMFAKNFGEENATNINGMFEKTLLLKNQQLGMIHWAEKVSGIVPEVKRDMLTRIRNMDAILDPTTEQPFLTDLISKRLGLNIKPEEARALSALSRKTTLLEKAANTDGTFDTKEQRLAYGASKVALENYFNELKLQAKSGTFSRGILSRIAGTVYELPGFLKSAVASFDNSFWGRQGIKALADVKTSGVWGKNFLKSWSDLGRQLFAKGKWYKSGDEAVMDSIKADIFSRPNAINGKYNAGKYGLNVFNEEAYPSSLPEKIPLLGRIFKASEIAYNGGAMRLRADMADRLIKMAENNGVNTLDPKEARPIGNLVGSLTGRGSYGKGDVLAKEANVLFFSVKFLKANIDTLLAPTEYIRAKVSEKLGMREEMTPGTNFAKKEAAKSTLRIIATMAFILFLAKMIDPDSVEEDPRSSRFGKVKIFGRWVDITGGMGGITTLVSKLTPSYHEGKWSFWTKNAQGEYTDLLSGEFGKQNAMDVFDSFFQGKLAPIAGIVRDLWKGEMYNGEKTSIFEIAKAQLPIMVQNYDQITKDPNSTFPLGSLILDLLGFSVSSYVEPNSTSKVIPTNKWQTKTTFTQDVLAFANAFGTDPAVAIDRLFSGQKILQVSDGGIIVVDRQSVAESEAFKKQWVKDHGGKISDIKEVKLDHTIPNKLGGSEEASNWKIVSTAVWASYTKTENALIKGVKEGKIGLKDAQAEIVKFKKIDDTAKRKVYGEALQNKLKNKTTSFNLVKPAYAAEGKPAPTFTPRQQEVYDKWSENWVNSKSTFYDPTDPSQTKANPDGIGAYGRKIGSGSVAFGNRVFEDQLKAGEKIYIQIQGMESVKTPYGMGVFRIDDTMNARYNKQGLYKIDFVREDMTPELVKRGAFNTKFKIVEINQPTKKSPVKIPLKFPENKNIGIG